MVRISIVMVLAILSAQVAQAQDWFTGFEKPAANPIMKADSSYLFTCPILKEPVSWQQADVFNPAAIVRHDTVFLLFRAEDNPDAILGGRTSRIGLAYSTDGIRFTKMEKPVLFPENDAWQKWDYPGGVEDPRVVELEDGGYLMMYTSWNQDVARLSAATSTDLRKWKKHGPVFADAHGGRYLDEWSKSGSLITELRDGRLIAKKFDGYYLMYWGELFMNLARSRDGIAWEPLLNESGDLLQVFKPTIESFDSHLVEPGPPALVTPEGILLLYNGKNLSGEGAGKSTPEGSYCGGQVLFDINDPARVLARKDTPFICPDLPHEITGQYQAGTTFVEGLVFYRNQWLLYYGTADSMVGLAVREGGYLPNE